jgi:hypothetical protein
MSNGTGVRSGPMTFRRQWSLGMINLMKVSDGKPPENAMKTVFSSVLTATGGKMRLGS